MAGILKVLPLFIMVMPGMISRVLYPSETWDQQLLNFAFSGNTLEHCILFPASADLVACVVPEKCYDICQSYAGCSNIAYPRLVLGIMPTGATSSLNPFIFLIRGSRIPMSLVFISLSKSFTGAWLNSRGTGSNDGSDDCSSDVGSRLHLQQFQHSLYHWHLSALTKKGLDKGIANSWQVNADGTLWIILIGLIESPLEGMFIIVHDGDVSLQCQECHLSWWYSFPHRVFIIVMTGVAIAWVPVVKETQGGQVFIYIQEVINYLAPPVACVFIIAVLWPRCNEQVSLITRELKFQVELISLWLFRKCVLVGMT